MNHERRRLERCALELPTTLETLIDQGATQQKVIMHLLTSDVSADGAYFKTTAPIPVGVNVNISMKLIIPDLNAIKNRYAHITVKGKTVRSEQAGVAVQFEPAYHIVSHTDS